MKCFYTFKDICKSHSSTHWCNEQALQPVSTSDDMHDVSRTDQAVVEKQLLFKSSNSTEPTRWAMNLPITPHCRLDTQFSYHRHALYQITTLLYLATTGRAPNRVATVAHDGSKHYCLRQTSAWLSVWNVRATFVQQFTQCLWAPVMILSQVHLRKPCYDFYFF